ncbi:hypothetical protein COX03_02320 [Candidatus Woesebacteria bacterium CG22_combo_CG10-13_8_21_14_all_39_10]|uniref:POTRA domain-containing protein n=3 Tax=Candidatus Woeseibacteriota TaxID=1752722 RepID=A0A2M7AQ14_9BACT|nr:MAG: hypothetical protein COX03_02320 [Candidatus Woesebacteria bacterium CG22_combo_CG10-13_8_21_14_all_39_10]PIU71735.1 MAG: hypothetical protein COS80_01645 [Candidatus Woesebacteria bacterium CG06_land_8_20_14_3_00_39_27]PIZ50046.1 MAG: hypothetical protein COY29_00560 [Candidatus Woesebacteria bacterium CG_4_10_14_0_2_um_filter_39_14]
MKYIRFGIYILLAFFLIVPFLVFPRIVRVRVVECYNQYGLCSSDFMAKVNLASGKSINDAKKMVAEEFKNTKLIDNYSFRFKLPATLRIDILLKKPKYALLNKNTNEIAVLDNKGTVLEKTDKTNLPYVVTGDNLPNVGEVVESKKTFALELLYSIYYLYQVKSGEIVKDSLELSIPKEGKIIFPLEGERDILLGSMKLILSRAGKFKEIDLRYKNPVIRYE